MRLAKRVKQFIRSLDNFTLAFVMGMMLYIDGGIKNELSLATPWHQLIVIHSILATIYILLSYSIILSSKRIFTKLNNKSHGNSKRK
ncbi:hypothetical protein QTG56_24190 (plasmid) [Rossellomorea sp. AcN35-11]|nr:hypothetical protein [Rossellomorea aquimaris]WJV31740.1 hypothetical protein QTG56_24190 [Rossellomorea sp. AcN35-11]